MDTILTVRELTERVRHTLEQRFPYVWVRGEVTNLSRPSSGHVYFSLKDGEALLACVWFRGQQRAQESFDPLTGEVWEGGPRLSPATRLENGQALVCAGRLAVYAPRGAYQLVVDLAQETGQGQWHLAFEALKEKLAAQGWFAQERKRPIPFNPQRVALITALTGAALQDFLRIAAERGLGSHIRIFPSPVQGDEAPPRIVAALQEAERQGWAEVIVLIRGGGSIQDLWAFNDERVASAIFSSGLPVLTGVGHEIDHSIADFVADRSAATPSHAAQLLWPERRMHVQQVDDKEGALHAAVQRAFLQPESRLAALERSLSLLSPARRLQRQGQELDELAVRLQPALYRQLDDHSRAVERLIGAVHREAGLTALHQWERELAQLEPRLKQGGAHEVTRAAHGLALMEERFLPLATTVVERSHISFERLALRLEALNPLAPLERGYALLRDGQGRIISGTQAVRPGDSVEVEVKNGFVAATVKGVRNK